MRNFLRDQSGSSLPLHAAFLAVGTILLGGILNSGMSYLEDRRMQALADLIALVSVRDQDYSADLAREIITDQGREARLYDPVMIPGQYTPDPRLQPEDRFAPGARPYNSVRVLLHASGDTAETRGRLLARAAAAREDRISYAIGSRLIRIEDGVSGALLQGLLGLDTAVTVADYNALAAVRIESFAFLDQVSAVRGIEVASFDELLRLDLPPQTIIEAVVRSADAASQPALRSLSRSIRLPSRRIAMSQIAAFDAELERAMTNGGGIRLSALDLITASALVAQDGRQVGVDLDARLARVQLEIGEDVQSPPLDSAGRPGSRAETRQIGLLVETAGGLQATRLRLEAAQAEAEVLRVTCTGGRDVEAEFLVETSPAQLMIDAGGLLSRPIIVDLGRGERQRITMTRADIDSGRPVRVSSGASLSADLPGLSQTLRPLIANMEALLNDAGLHLGEADLFLRDASCGHAFLVE